MNRRRWIACLLLPLFLSSAGCWLDDPFWDDDGYGSGAPPYVGGPVGMAPTYYGGSAGPGVVPVAMQTAEPPR
ncbi:MAG: hypothetical protein K2X38_24530 [Gemmataceae bacterium]|nr:hypothetical protein [Gemmataceae bacterium]